MKGWRVVLVGAVGSTERTLAGLIKHRVEVVGLAALAASRAHTVSGWRDFAPLARAHGIPLVSFEHVNSEAMLAQVRAWAPDVLLVVGLSQLVGDALLAAAPRGSIGFHPTRLPLGRGRAPLAWLALGAAPGAATFFFMTAGADEGPVVAQALFDVSPGDDAAQVELRMLEAIDAALDELGPALVSGSVIGTPQDHACATWLGRRAEEDGVVDWEASAAEVLSLVRASAPPNPGALSYWRDEPVRILAAEPATGAAARWRGVPGRVLEVDAAGTLLVQCGDAPVRVTRHTGTAGKSVPTGARLGYVADAELASLRRRVAELERLVKLYGESKP